MEEKNKYERKKQEREQSRENELRQVRAKKTARTLFIYGGALLIVAGVGYGLFAFSRPSAPPDGDDSTSVTYPIQGRAHIADGAAHAPYNSNPPSSGPHYASPARGGFYDDALPDERVIHNLEHGDIWIAYRSQLPDEVKSALRSFAGPYVVVSPRQENDGDISLVAWGRVDTFNLENGALDEARIRDFIARYDNRGPERLRGAGAGHGGL